MRKREQEAILRTKKHKISTAQAQVPTMVFMLCTPCTFNEIRIARIAGLQYEKKKTRSNT